MAIHSFSIQFIKDSFQNKKLRICLELKDSCSFIELDVIHFEIAAQILKVLETINRYLKKIIKTYCRIEFYAKGQGPFSHSNLSIKHKTIFKI